MTKALENLAAANVARRENKLIRQYLRQLPRAQAADAVIELLVGTHHSAPAAIGAMRVSVLIRSISYVGATRTRQIMARADIHGDPRLRELCQSQRVRLALHVARTLQTGSTPA
jgi:hypothetical protein